MCAAAGVPARRSISGSISVCLECLGAFWSMASSMHSPLFMTRGSPRATSCHAALAVSAWPGIFVGCFVSRMAAASAFFHSLIHCLVSVSFNTVSLLGLAGLWTRNSIWPLRSFGVSLHATTVCGVGSLRFAQASPIQLCPSVFQPFCRRRFAAMISSESTWCRSVLVPASFGAVAGGAEPYAY